MIRLHQLLLLTPGFFLVSATTTTECPFSCQCYQQSGIDSIFCVNVDRRYIPNYFNFDVKLLNFSCNSLFHLSQNAFQNQRYKSLEILDLKQNAISKIDNKAFSKLKNLLEIDLSRNQLHSINRNMFKNNKFLNTIVIRENPIKKLKDHSFPSSIYLRHLDFQGCKINKIHISAFINAPMIEYINLKDNNLSSLSPNVLHNSSQLKYFLIDGNPWMCNKALWLLLKWLHNYEVRKEDSILCIYGETDTAILWDTMELKNPRKFDNILHQTFNRERSRRSFSKISDDSIIFKVPVEENLVIAESKRMVPRNISSYATPGKESSRENDIQDSDEEKSNINQHNHHRGKHRKWLNTRLSSTNPGVTLTRNANYHDDSFESFEKSIEHTNVNSDYKKSSNFEDFGYNEEKIRKEHSHLNEAENIFESAPKFKTYSELRKIGLNGDIIYVYSNKEDTSQPGNKILYDEKSKNNNIQSEVHSEEPQITDEIVNMNVMFALITIEFTLLVVLLYILYKLWKWNRKNDDTTADVGLNNSNKNGKTQDTDSPGYKRYSLPDDNFSLKTSNHDDIKCDSESGYLSYHRYNSTEEGESNNEFSFYRSYPQNETIKNFATVNFHENSHKTLTYGTLERTNYERSETEMDRSIRRNLSVRSLGRRTKVYNRRSKSADNTDQYDENENDENANH